MDPNATFRFFPKLAQELRDMIWNAAVRTEDKGFQAIYFSPYRPGRDHLETNRSFIYGHNDDAARSGWLATGDTTVKAIPQAPMILTQHLFEKQKPNRTKESWRRTNQSLYLEDAGLWTACKDSRRVIDSVYRRLRRAIPRPQLPATRLTTNTPNSTALSTTCVGTQPTTDNRTREVALMGRIPNNYDATEHSLFHISTEDIVCVQFDSLLRTLNGKMEIIQFTELICEALDRVNHLALEFDRSMIVDLEHGAPRGFSRSTTDSSAYSMLWADEDWPLGLQAKPYSPVVHLLRAAKRARNNIIDNGGSPPITVWLIDPTIKRAANHEETTVNEPNTTSTEGPSERAVFRGRGCKLTEVRVGDAGWTGPSIDPGHECSPRHIWYVGPDDIPNLDCGAHCAIRRIANRVHPGRREGMTTEQLFEGFQRGSLRVLAVEYGQA